MPLQVDIRARVFGPDDRAYRVFPGHNYRHFEAMVAGSVVFLDFPGMPTPGRNGYEKDAVSLEAIVRAERQAAIAFRNDDRVGELLAQVGREDIGAVRWSRRREQILVWWNGLYRDARPGDLVVVPAQQRYGGADMQKTRVGEIVGLAQRWVQGAPAVYSRAGMLVRRVNWLAEIDERDLDVRTLATLRTPNPLVLVRADQLRPVLGAAYKNVVVNDEFLARFVTSGEDVAREAFHFQAFVLATVEAYRRRTSEQPIPFVDSIYKVAAAVARGDPNLPEQDVSIHSPGYSTLKSARDVVFVIAALFASALELPAQAFDQNGNPAISLINSESAAYDPCAPEGLEEQVLQTLRIIGLERWEEMCEAARKAHENEGFTPISSASPRPRPDRE